MTEVTSSPGATLRKELLEHSFRQVYQGPGVRQFAIALSLGSLTIGAYLLLDAFSQTRPVSPTSTTLRILLALGYAGAALAAYFGHSFIRRHYTSILNVSIVLGMAAASLLPIAVHGTVSVERFYWSLNTSLATSVLICYGFTRLSALNTAVIVTAGCIAGFATAFAVPVVDPYLLGRLVLHVSILHFAAYSLRKTVENRERELFFLAEENLSKNIYAKELEAANARAEEGNRVKLRFLENMSHEFRTPMNGVIQTLELAARSASGELRWLIDQASRSGHALLATLDRILDYSRWTRDAVTPTLAVTSASAVGRAAVDRFASRASKRQLALALRLDLATPQDRIVTDRAMLDEILDQLLDNAVRFTQQGGRIDVEVSLKNRADAPYPAALLQATVANTGGGIPPDLHEHIYQAFYQVDDGSNRKLGGTGLGLAIVKRLVDLLDGSITLVSRQGTGATFRVSVPVQAERQASLLEDSRTIGADVLDAGKDLLAGHVLLVEDNDLNASLAQALLTRLGLRVTRAIDGQAALEAACAQSFDAILMDCQMPVVDGYESTRRIRASEVEYRRTAVPIIALTANALSGERQKCLAAGMNDYLAKPYTAVQLQRVLAAWLKTKQPVVS